MRLVGYTFFKFLGSSISSARDAVARHRAAIIGKAGDRRDIFARLQGKKRVGMREARISGVDSRARRADAARVIHQFDL